MGTGFSETLPAADRRRAVVATVMWVSLVLGVTIGRAVPALPGVAELGFRAVGVLAAAYVVGVQVRGSTGSRVPPSLLLGFVAVPAVGAVLALARLEPGDAVNHLASVLALVAASRLPASLLAVSLRRALVVIVGASLALGLVYPDVVSTNERAFLRPVYDGRLVGLLGSANVLGTVGVLLVVVAVLASAGRQRWAAVALALLGILASSSQTSMAVAALVLLLAGVLRVRRAGAGAPMLAAAAFASAAGVVAAAMWLNAPGGRDVAGMLSGITFSRRTAVWEVVLQQDVPFLGVGQSEIQRLFETTEIQGAIGISSVHNGVLDAWLRDGIPGLVALAASLAAMVATAWRARADLVLLPGAVLVVVGALEVFPTHVPYFAMIYALVLVALDRSGAAVLGRGAASAGRRLPGLVRPAA
ncbi:O-antigen ligase family protein [Nocardioides marmoraquaticus]